MARTISSSYASGITLTSAADNPVTITGTIDTGTGTALTAVAPVYWTISNQGLVETTGTSGSGVELPAFQASLDNTGTIAGQYGVVFSRYTAIGAGSVLSNEGRISGVDFGVWASLSTTITNGSNGVILGGTFGVLGATVLRGAVHLDNAGTISSNGDGTRSVAVYLRDPTTIINEAGGLINSSGADIASEYYFGQTIINRGTISNAFTLDNPALKDPAINAFGADVTNAASGRIFSQYQGIPLGYNISNAGTILTRDLGVSAARLTNAAGALITSQLTLAVYSTGTVTNAGTIATNSDGDAIQFSAGSNGRLVVEPGAVFFGAVDGGNTPGGTAVSTLEFGAGAGTLTAVGSNYVNFGSIAFDNGAAWMVSGSAAGLAGGQTISGFAPGDTIELTGLSASYAGFGGGALTLSNAATLLFQGAFEGEHFVVTPGTNTDITLACFCAGTRLLTTRGEVRVEAVRPGMRLVSIPHQKPVPVRWVGWRRARVAPVRIARGAFGGGQPHRELWLSPDHAVFVDGALIPVRYLLNGASIAEARCETVLYVHVELAQHGALLAEGLPAESYLDTGTRAAFATGSDAPAGRPRTRAD